MLDAFTTGAAVLLNDANASVAGTFVPAVGDEVAVRVIVTAPDPVIKAARGPGARNPGHRMVLEAKHLSGRPQAKKDKIRVDSTTYLITDVEAETRGHWFTCDVDPVP